MTIQRIIEIRAERSTDTVKDLKQEISDLKDALLNVEEGTKDYDKGVKLLQEDQRRLNEVNALTKKENVALTGSYYDLNAQLVQARKDWKNLTAAQREDAEVGGALIQKIQSLDRQLKDMDASIGQYQRNVGDYRGALTDWGDSLSKLPGGMGAVVGGLKNMGSAMKLVSSNPLMAIIGILAPMLQGIAKAVKENEGAMNAIRASMKLLEPIGNAISSIFETIGEKVSDVVKWLGNLLKSNTDTFGKMTSTLAGFGNALLQYILTPIRTVIAAVKGLGKILGDVFKGEWGSIKEDAKAAGSEIADAWKKGFSFKENFNVGKEAGEQFVEGLKTAKPKVKEEAKKTKEEWLSELEYRKYILKQQIALEKENSEEMVALKQALREAEFEEEKQRLEKTIKDEEERNAAIKLAEQVKNQDLFNIAQDAYVARLDAEQKYQDEMAKKREEQRKAEEKAEQDRLKAEQAAWEKLHNAKVATVKNAFSTMLSLYEAFGDESAKESEGYKAIASAQAAVQAMLSANEAYAAMASIPYVGPVLGGIAAAAALAQGMAQVRQINATNMKAVAPTTTASTSAPSASVSAPAVVQQVEATRTVTGVKEEERLNNAQRVYVVYDDIDQAGKKVDVTTSEATF